MFYTKTKNGNTIPQDFIDNLDPLPQGLEIIDAPYLDEKMVLYTEKLNKFYNDLLDLLANAPSIEHCSYKEEEMYADMANLLNSMKNAGYGKM